MLWDLDAWEFSSYAADGERDRFMPPHGIEPAFQKRFLDLLGDRELAPIGAGLAVEGGCAAGRRL